MTFYERFLLTFKKQKVYKLVIVHKGRRLETRIGEPTEDNLITLGDKTFTINDEAVFYDEKGVKTFIFNGEDPTPVTPMPVHEWNPSEISTRDLGKAVNESVTAKIIRAQDSESKLMPRLTMGFVIIAALIIAMLVFMYIQFDTVFDYISENGQGGLS